MNTLIPGEMPLADAATPKAIPNGITNAAIGAISTLPRLTPLAVKRGRSSWFELGISPAISGSFETGRVIRSTDWKPPCGSGRRRLLAQSGLNAMPAHLSAFGAKRTCRDRRRCIDQSRMAHERDGGVARSQITSKHDRQAHRHQLCRDRRVEGPTLLRRHPRS